MKSTILIILLPVFSVFFGTPTAHSAETSSPSQVLTQYRITTPFPGIEQGAATTIAQYLGNLFTFSLTIIGAVAIGAIVWWSIVWISSRGNPTEISRAKSGIWQAVLGIIFLFASYVILNTINPELVNIGGTENRLISIPRVQLENATTTSSAPGVYLIYQDYFPGNGCFYLTAQNTFCPASYPRDRGVHVFVDRNNQASVVGTNRLCEASSCP